MRAAVVLCLAVLMAASSVSAYREYAHRLQAGGALEQVHAQVAQDDRATRLDIATRKATCPFIGSIVNMALLPVTQHNAAANTQPLGAIDTVVSIGNTPKGSTLGHVLRVFTTGNHAKMFGPDGKLSVAVPPGTFALDFPGSQGAHPGHSGILMGDPHALNSGRWSAADWQRLLKKAANGVLTTQQIGAFIGENVHADPKAKTITDFSLVGLLLSDTVKLIGQVMATATQVFTDPVKATPEQWRAVVTGITKIAADDNLIGSAGEFGLLLAFLEHSPVTIQHKGAAFAVSDLTSMFEHKVLPGGWESWHKSALSWIRYSTELTYHARAAYNALPKRK